MLWQDLSSAIICELKKCFKESIYQLLVSIRFKNQKKNHCVVGFRVICSLLVNDHIDLVISLSNKVISCDVINRRKNKNSRRDFLRSTLLLVYVLQYPQELESSFQEYQCPSSISCSTQSLSSFRISNPPTFPS